MLVRVQAVKCPPVRPAAMRAGRHRPRLGDAFDVVDGDILHVAFQHADAVSAFGEPLTDQAAVEQGGVDGAARLVVELDVEAAVAGVGGFYADGVADLGARIAQALGAGTGGRHQGGDVLGQKFVVIVEEVEPFPACGVEREVGRFGAAERPVWFGVDEAKRSVCGNERLVAAAAGRDQDDFQIRSGLGRGGGDGAPQGGAIHAADQNGNQWVAHVLAPVWCRRFGHTQPQGCVGDVAPTYAADVNVAVCGSPPSGA